MTFIVITHRGTKDPRVGNSIFQLAHNITAHATYTTATTMRIRNMLITLVVNTNNRASLHNRQIRRQVLILIFLTLTYNLIGHT